MNKKILIAIFVIVAIVIGVVAYFVLSDYQQEEKLTAELTEISNLSNSENMDINKINEMLDRTVTKGDYAVVERACKEYLKDSFDNIVKIAEVMNDDKITNVLTVSNYQEDGKEFTNTKNYITTTKQTLEDCKAKYVEFFTQEKAMSYINDKGLDSYYTDLYKNEFVGDIESQYTDKTVENSIDEILGILNVYEEVINFLVENQNSWEISNDNIVFNSQSLSDQYTELVNKL